MLSDESQTSGADAGCKDGGVAAVECLARAGVSAASDNTGHEAALAPGRRSRSWKEGAAATRWETTAGVGWRLRG
jgi:hypothetical protein